MRYADEALKADGAAPQGAKLTALAVHALAPADRRWVLERLDARQRHALEPLLTELNELGMPTDASSALSQVDAQRGAALASTPAERAPDSGVPPELKRWLALSDAEPASLVALALQPHGRAVQQAALGELPALRRKQIQAELERLGDQDFVQRKLAQCLAAEIAMLPTLPAQADTPQPLVPRPQLARRSIYGHLRDGIERCAAIARRRIGRTERRG